MTLGPITRIPADMLRPDGLLCFGEDLVDWQACIGAAPTHSYRGVHAALVDDRLHVLAPWGSAAVEGVLWELTIRPGMERLALWGTAGALPRYSGPADEAVIVKKAVAATMAGMKDGQGGAPTMEAPGDIPRVNAISTDRFYGASPAGAQWDDVRHFDAIIDMESAAFYRILEDRAASVQRIAVRCVANPVADLDALPAGAPDAMRAALDAALRCLA